MLHFGYEYTEIAFKGCGSISKVVAAIGHDDFHERLLDYLHRTVGAEHCAIFLLERQGPINIGASSIDGPGWSSAAIDAYTARFWRADPTMVAAAEQGKVAHPNLMRLDIDRLPPSGFRDIVYRRQNVSERLLLTGSPVQPQVGLSILRSNKRGKFSSSDIERVVEMGETLLSLAAKHAELVCHRTDLLVALGSLDTIARCMERAPEMLPRREVEVCSRILFGQSSLTISIELSIGEETVKTYRKRAYQRLGVATQRELLMWYVSLWETTRSAVH